MRSLTVGFCLLALSGCSHIPRWNHGAEPTAAAVPQLTLAPEHREDAGFVRDAAGIGAVSPPARVGDRLFFLDGDSRLHAYDLTGATLYTVDLKPADEEARAGRGGGVAAAPNGNTVYVATGFGHIHALNAADGSILRTVSAERPVRAAPALGPRALLVRTVDDRLLILDPQTLEIRDVRRMPPTYGAGAPFTAPALDATGAAVPLSSGEAVLFGNFTGGREGVRRSLQPFGTPPRGGAPDAVVQNPVVREGVAYLTADGGLSAAVDLKTGRTLWTQSFGGRGPLIVTGDRVIGIDAGEVFALARDDGRLLYKTPFTAENPTGIVAVGDRLFAAASGKVLLLHAADGRLLGAADGPERPLAPVSIGARVYLVGDGRLWVYRP